ncbi:conserved hypothetical protein [Actinosynnema mirum DSM 43827]|uniref:Ig-like domain-containing protein n=1 Tax=Actinosynnema mirum (strain ATCC 29888 / DSM 43827 / JCM 3225 / NBRC 14064 / NCIMB 13271 / NRRL B-12336 / IMRU 3971 / 101) TaxID=446462 RepID=C6WCR6_ACTMD|nr:conserved hypothetical protein [Actinosynnema mirum DSM 43827]
MVGSIAGRLLRGLLAVLVVASGVVPIVVFTAATAQAAGPCDAPVANKIVCENTKPGATDWQVTSKDDSILGFTTDISYAPGETVEFKMLTPATSYRIDLYRLGYYGGAGARLMGSATRTTPQNQPACDRDTTPMPTYPTGTALIDCGNWAVSTTWTVPQDAVSGIYYARMSRTDVPADQPAVNELAFVVRDDTATGKVMFQTSDSTWVAYNRYGGNSLYFGDGPGQGGQAYKVSYNRPYTGGDGDENFIFNAEYPMLRFLESNGYDLTYTTDVDSARRGELIKKQKVFMAVGHDEYWSNEQRANVEAARAAGVHLAFLTGNEIFWKTRWEASKFGTKRDWRTIASFKETKGTQNDGLPDWTGTWRDPRFPEQDGGRPENSLLGNIFVVNGRRDDSLQVPAQYGKMRLWRNTDLQTMAAGSTYTFQPGTLGYEWNVVPDNGFQPAGVGQFSRTTVAMLDGPYVLQNYGDHYTPDTATHALTYYKDQRSGALVFGAGTVQWAWGLDDDHAFLTNTPTSDVRMQQATVNILADMGVKAATLRTGLTQSDGITDNQAPTAAFTSVPALSTVGAAYTFSGTVADAAGQVTGVEVSTDGGTRWHPANWLAGQTSWSYTYTPTKSGPATLQVRAVDDSLNLSSPVSATPGVGARTCPCGLWTDADKPKNPDNADSGALELGVKWQSSTDGYVRGVRFYKGPNDTGTHVGTLWTADGRQLATGTFTGETASGWQTLAFPIPVKVDKNTTYVVSYLSPTGHFASDSEYFSFSSRYLEPLTAPQTVRPSGAPGDLGNANGVFRGGAGFPNRSSLDTNYWVDVVWAPDPGPDTRAPELVSTSPVSSSASVGLTPTLSAAYDEGLNPASTQFTLTGPDGQVAGATSVTGDGRTAQFTPAAELRTGTTYTASVRVKDAAGNQTPEHTWTFTTGSHRPAACPCTVWDDFASPETQSADDATPVELGTKVRFNGKGEVLGVRFFKGANNTGTHTGSLWDATGKLLATGVFTGESTSGWQTLTFASPVVVQANTTYVVSYYAPKGHYAVTPGYFNGQTAAYGALRALAAGVDGPNGVFRYGTGGGFPNASHNSANYWVDVVFRNGLNGDTTPPTLDSRTPAPNATDVALTAPLALTFNEPVDPASAQVWLSDPGGAKLHGEVSLSGDQKTLTWTPTGKLQPNTRYGVSALIADANGNAMAAPAEWSFTTTRTAACPCSLFSAATVPSTTSADDGGSYELGVRFTPTQSGQITGVRFYKGAGNTGTHTGSLWTSTGSRMATGTFVNETATGWQTLVFTNPVTVAPGLTYVASYTAPNGHYAIDQGYFQATGVDAPPLTAPRTGDGSPNGVFQPGGGFPTVSYQGNNYWVDVVYTPSSDTTPPVATGNTPLAGATGVDLRPTVTASFDEPVEANNTQFAVTDGGGARIDGTITLSGDRRTVSWTPKADLTPTTRHVVTARAADDGGNIMAEPLTWSFTTSADQTCPCSLFSAATVPSTTSADDGGSYELGVRFTPKADGKVTGVRFYKGAGNTGTHTGTVWSTDGTSLKTGTFTDETATGWQTLTFAEPLQVTAGTTYIASYSAPNGHFAINQGYFGGYAVDTPKLSSPATDELSRNGLFQPGGGFPTNSYQGNNYWVDVVYTTA